MIALFNDQNLNTWITALGYTGLTAVLFLETGIFLGFFLPGDSLIFTAGILAAKGIFHLSWLMPLGIVAAILGYIVGYWLGKKLGFWLMRREDSFWFKKKYLLNAKIFYEHHGGKALILGRFIPIVRTFVPIVAGMTNMFYRKYFLYNLLGALLWVGGLLLLGYFVGDLIPDAANFILYAALLIILFSLTPLIWAYAKMKFKRNGR